MNRRKSERRVYPRIYAKVSVTFKNLDEMVMGYTENISGGGVYLKTDRLIDPNAELELNLHLEDPDETYQIKGRVVRLITLSHPDEQGLMMYGAGIQFKDIPEKFSKRLEEAVKKQRAV